MEKNALQILGLNNEKMTFIIMTILALFVILCFILCMINMSKLHDLSGDGGEIPSVDQLKKYLKKMKQLSDNAEDIYASLSKMNNSGPGEEKSDPVISVRPDTKAFTKYHIVHFNAFPGVTGSVSFSFALLTNSNDGIILTSLYGHDSCNTYIREIHKGECNITLLKEEEEALTKAMEGEKIGQK